MNAPMSSRKPLVACETVTGGAAVSRRRAVTWSGGVVSVCLSTAALADRFPAPAQPLDSRGFQDRGSGPTYSESGRIRRLSAYCSRMWAVQPAMREAANRGV
jgi:hypothetical protein